MQVEDRLAAAGADVDDDAVVGQAGARGTGRTEHPLRLLGGNGRRRGRCQRGVGQDEQVRLGLRVDVPDRDEAVARSRRPRRRGGRRRGSRQAARIPSSATAAPDAHELADGRLDDPGRVVGTVAAARPVDRTRSSPPTFSAQRARHASSESPAGGRSAPSSPGGTVSSSAVRVPGRGE